MDDEDRNRGGLSRQKDDEDDEEPEDSVFAIPSKPVAYGDDEGEGEEEDREDRKDRRDRRQKKENLSRDPTINLTTTRTFTPRLARSQKDRDAQRGRSADRHSNLPRRSVFWKRTPSEAGAGNRRAPVKLLIGYPTGPGNPRDRYYYPARKRSKAARESVQGDADVFIHGTNTASNKVAFVSDIMGFSASGAPQAEVMIYNPDLCEQVRNLADVNRLDKLQTSILAYGVSRPGSVNGVSYKIVESFKNDPAPIIDFVARAGAGGRAVAMMESDDIDDAEEDAMTAEQVKKFLEKAAAQPEVVEFLSERAFPDEAALSAEVDRVNRLLSKATGAGKVRRMGESDRGSARPTKPKFDLKEYERRMQEAERRVGLTPAQLVPLED